MGIISHFPGGSAGGGTGLPEFTYTGQYQLIDEGEGDWRIKFLTSGILKFAKLGGAKGGIDVFLVGGGGACGYSAGISDWCGPGGGGYTKTIRSVSVQENVEYPIVIGAGGQRSTVSNTQTQGGQTSAMNTSVEGGWSGKSISGGNGGSGAASSNSTLGGTDGGDGQKGANGVGEAGKGQGTTTREFGESTGTLYASGGSYNVNNGTNNVGNGADNTGNGGGGTNNNSKQTKGGSGIAVIRNSRFAIIQQPQDASVAEDASAVFTVKESGTGVKYQWQFLPANGDSATGWSNTSAEGATTASLTIVAASYRNGYKYRCIVSKGSSQLISDAATLTITA